MNQTTIYLDTLHTAMLQFSPVDAIKHSKSIGISYVTYGLLLLYVRVLDEESFTLSFNFNSDSDSDLSFGMERSSNTLHSSIAP